MKRNALSKALRKLALALDAVGIVRTDLDANGELLKTDDRRIAELDMALRAMRAATRAVMAVMSA